jgi:hypothetical protein
VQVAESTFTSRAPFQTRKTVSRERSRNGAHAWHRHVGGQVAQRAGSNPPFLFGALRRADRKDAEERGQPSANDGDDGVDQKGEGPATTRLWGMCLRWRHGLRGSPCEPGAIHTMALTSATSAAYSAGQGLEVRDS